MFVEHGTREETCGYHSSRTIRSFNSPFANETIEIAGDVSLDEDVAAIRQCFTVRRCSASLSCTNNVASSSRHCFTSLNRLRQALFKRKSLFSTVEEPPQSRDQFVRSMKYDRKSNKARFILPFFIEKN